LRGATDAVLDAITEQLVRLRGGDPPAQRWDPRLHGQATIGNFRRGSAAGAGVDGTGTGTGGGVGGGGAGGSGA